MLIPDAPRALREVRGSDAELLHLSVLLAAMDGEAPLPLATMRERYAASAMPPCAAIRTTAAT
ncbi:hypothetical protein [Cupriavidus sp. H39]|uniref:hypothetical protein n=1 Tax=Cupriavidus sp. H39 TaxID=3401635 RepID=UPI003D0493D3